MPSSVLDVSVRVISLKCSAMLGNNKEQPPNLDFGSQNFYSTFPTQENVKILSHILRKLHVNFSHERFIFISRLATNPTSSEIPKKSQILYVR